MQLSVVFLSLLPLATASAGCPSDLAALTKAVDAAEAAYTGLLEDRFRWSRHEARRLLGCLETPAPEALAARLHLLEILDARLVGDDARLEDAIEGMVAADPDYQPDSRVAPSGSSLDRAIDMARGDSWSNETRRLPEADGVDWIVDGATASQFPLDRATVVQRLGGDAQGWYLTGGEVPEALLPAPMERLGRPLTAAAITAGVLAGAAWTAATLTAPDPGDLKGDEALGAHQALAWAGTGLGAGALGLGAAAVITTRWEF